MNKTNTFHKHRLLSAVAFIILFPCIVSAQIHDERWDIKTCADAASADIKDTVIATTVDSQFNLSIHPKGWWRVNLQRQPDEMQRLRLTGIVLRIQPETDGDIHLVLIGANSSHMNVEVPDPKYVPPSGRFTDEIKAARREAQAVTVGETVQVEGIGFWDKLHGTQYEAPNGREIHPVLKVVPVPGNPLKISSASPSSSGRPTIQQQADAADPNPVVGYTATGLPIHLGPRGGHYHWSKSGKKQYEKRR